MSQEKLDRIDLKILAQLQNSGRITNIELADLVGLSPSPCLTRVKRLEKAGYISGYQRADKSAQARRVSDGLHRSHADGASQRRLFAVRVPDPQDRRDPRVPYGERRI